MLSTGIGSQEGVHTPVLLALSQAVSGHLKNICNCFCFCGFVVVVVVFYYTGSLLLENVFVS